MNAMNQLFGNLLKACSEIWKAIGIAQKVSIILIGIVTIAVISLIIYWGSQPDWQVLYADLDRKTAAKVYDIVKEENVPVKFADGGKTILVPADKVYKLRMLVINKGIPVTKTGVGWEIFDKMKIGLTDRQQEIAFQRAVQGELERMITAMPGVAGCNVMLNLPKKKIFSKKIARPSASIMVVMTGGRKLSLKEIDSIRFLVSSAIEGMQPDDVTITDNHGNVLARRTNESEASSFLTDRQIALRRATEEELKQKAEAILLPIVGYDKNTSQPNVIAMVSCDMDFSKSDEVIEQYDAANQVVISEKVIDEDSTKAKPQPKGPVGTKSNLVAVNNPAGGTNKESNLSQQKKKISQKQYVVPKTIKKISSRGGIIKKIAVSVTIATKPDGKEWSQADMKKFEELVKGAVGAQNYGEGNAQVVVKQMPFYPVTTKKAPQLPITDKISLTIEQIIHSPVVRPILAIALLLLLYYIFKKNFAVVEREEGELETSEVYGENIKPIEAEKETEEVAATNELIGTLHELQEKTTSDPKLIANTMEKWLKADSASNIFS
ncbi:MAG: flagellar M-ring protein FliF [Bacteroidetes bacterium]|nr:MAG: flagellar M-ring protein FliF [Bacteroidota bacterium]